MRQTNSGSRQAVPPTFPAERKAVFAPKRRFGLRFVPAEFAFMRFVAGIRALLAAVFNVQLMVLLPPTIVWKVIGTAYLLWATILLWGTLRTQRFAAWPVWIWIDAALLVIGSRYAGSYSHVVAALTVLPVVAMSLRGGLVSSTLLAAACVASMLIGASALPNAAEGVSFGSASVIALLAIGPLTALLARPSRELIERLQVQENLQAHSDPRQGLRHHVEVLVSLLAKHFQANVITLSMQGLEPRIFQWRAGSSLNILSGDQEEPLRKRIDALPNDAGCIWFQISSATVSVRLIDSETGARRSPEPAVAAALQGTDTYGLALPLQNYGQPLGYLFIERSDAPFTPSQWLWVQELMRETLPLLERSDLLEQLQRETALRERERIGRDLHDSAVQPYLGLKYGLEALARRAGQDNPLNVPIAQLVQMTNSELQTLRDVVSGLRRGHDPAGDSASLDALQRQAQRFEALFGLKVTVFAPHAPHLRGSLAKAVLHMVNEALTNVRRHTSATAVTVLLDTHESDIVLRLRNDHGLGENLPDDFIPRSLSERAGEFAGSVSVEHESNFTEITISLPMLGSLH